MSNVAIQMPDCVQVEEASDTYGRFTLQPLERGFGVTVGNALRRVLLSSLPGAAITAIRIDGVQHEFSTIPGVAEDVAEIILNLKGVRFKPLENAEDVTVVSFTIEGPGEWTGADIAKAVEEYEVLNPDHHIATLAEDARLHVELRIERGRGYVPAEENKRADDPIGVIAIDAIFTPIKNVRYNVTPTRVGQRINFEKLVLEITTDGSITPEDALTSAAAILREHINLFIQVEVTPPQVEEEKTEVDAEVQRMRNLLLQSVDELDLSVRAQNCLKAANIKTIADLVRREESEMLKFRNFGRKSLQELVEVLQERGLRFGMDVDKYLEGEKIS